MKSLKQRWVLGHFFQTSTSTTTFFKIQNRSSTSTNKVNHLNKISKYKYKYTCYFSSTSTSKSAFKMCTLRIALSIMYILREKLNE